ncbi:retrovirus-related pol polyprotein from transposon TNT 1-94 [Tanacetum coccineum]
MLTSFLGLYILNGEQRITTIEESKDLTSLSLDELIRNLKVHEMIIKKDSEIVKAKGGRRSHALKSKKESSDEECLTFKSEDEEYVMAVRHFKKFFKRRECPKPPKDKNQRAFVGGYWSDSGEEDDEKDKEKMCLVAQASNEICRGVDLEPDKWIKDSGCSKHMTGNQKFFLSYKAYNGESLNVTFDETPPPSKTSPLVDDELDEEEAIKVTEKKNLENDIEDETLKIDEIVNIKESRNHPLENVIETLTKELLVSELVPQPKNMTIMGTKWVFRNKLDENGIGCRNKARLVAQGYNQQEGIDYNETYAPATRLESIRILIAYACALDFKLLQMDVKSSFLNDLSMRSPTKGRYQTTPPSPSVIKTLIQTPRQGLVTHVRKKKPIDVDDNEILNHEIQHHMSSWVEIIRENVFCLGGHRDHVSACLCHMLYCIETSTKYNLAFFILKRMKIIRNTPKGILPYGMLLTRLFTHIVSNLPESSNDRYILCDHVMYPLAPHYERKTRSDHGTKRCRSSNPSSSSNVLDHPSSSHHIIENNDGNNEESFHSNTPSPTQLVNSLSNNVPRVFENPPHENQTFHFYQTEILNHQSQPRDEHREGLRSIGNALKNVMRSKKK